MITIIMNVIMEDKPNDHMDYFVPLDWIWFNAK
jgi:hypothetical protein